MAITGLLLCGFLVVHLAGNVLLYVGPEAYNEYAHALHKQKALLAVAEAGLLLLFVVHIWLAWCTHRENCAARQRGREDRPDRRRLQSERGQVQPKDDRQKAVSEIANAAGGEQEPAVGRQGRQPGDRLPRDRPLAHDAPTTCAAATVRG